MLTFLFDQFLTFSALIEHFFTFFYLLDISLPVSEGINPAPKGLFISFDFFNGFSFDEILNGLNIVSAKSLTSHDEIIKLLASPISKATLHEFLYFCPFFYSETTLINLLGVFLFFFLFGMTTELLNKFLLSEVVFFFLEEVLKSLSIFVEMVFLQFDHFTLNSFTLIDTSLSTKHMIQIVVQILLIPAGLILKVQLHGHCFIQSLFIFFRLFIFLKVIKYVDLSQA